MHLNPMVELLRKARAGGYAVPSFCVWGSASIAVVRRTANRLKAPVIIMTSSFELKFFSPAEIARMAKAEEFESPAALLLDHGDSPELVQAFKKSLLSQWNTEPVPWMPVSIAEATEAMVPVVEKWIRLTGAAGKG